MLKKLICGITAAILLSAAVFAAEDITLNAGKDLLVYTAGGDNGKIAAALNIDSEELSSYISENNVEYFAVNKENTVQIKLTVNITEFSSSVSNLSNLSDGNIESLLPEITGIDGIRGEVLDKNGQKFAKIQLSSNDSGGDYAVTAAQKKLYVLSVSTAADESSDYADKAFSSLDCSDFNRVKAKKSYYGYIVLAAIILLVFVCAYIVFTLIRDITNDRTPKVDDTSL